MNKIVLEDNGFPFSAESVRFMQNASAEGIKNLCKLFGDDFIAFGCEVVGSNITAGAVVVNGEIIPFEAGTYNAKFSIEETSTAVTYKDNVNRPAYYTRVARCSAAGTYTLANFPRIRAVKKHTPLDWTLLSYDSAVTSEATTNTHIGVMFGNDIKAKKDANGTVTICGGGKWRNTTDAYTLTTLPSTMRPKTERSIPVVAYISSNFASYLSTYLGMATVQTDGKVIIPSELARNGAQEYIIPYFNAQFQID